MTDEIEELEDPIELESVDDTRIFTPDRSVLNHPEVSEIDHNYGGSSFPCAILDRDMQIVWTNMSFGEHFPEVTDANAHIASFFSLVEGSSPNTLFDGVRQKALGFSWRGQIELIRTDHARVIANLLVGPISRSPRISRGEAPQNEEPNSQHQTDRPADGDPPDVDGPLAFLAIIDDISDHHRNLVRGTFSSLLEASLLKDNDTGLHVGRVNEYCRLISEKLAQSGAYAEIDYEFVDTISFVAAMHDVGKIGTPDDILNKGGPLEDWEWDVMREHTINGAYILNTYPAPMAKQIALFHHEWWNGSGYPYAISGTMIPLEARIVALADVYDALRMKRAYKKAFTHDEACEEIGKGVESHFDPELAEIFLDSSEMLNDVYERLKDPDSDRPEE